MSFRFRLDGSSGVPVYRQLMDQVTGGLAAGKLAGGAQLPTVRQVAVDLAINPNTVIRAYRELEIRGILNTQQGTGTFISEQTEQRPSADRKRELEAIVMEFVARAGAQGFTITDLQKELKLRKDGGVS